ncbi:hypothetical protein AMTR_s00124p00104500 [Amborella trichopoda]|uniref:Uncharacterized protein n=1 Tax=Amborella trichopoda TaxID=13333 RepID=W1NR44_AMBTC|nr:hypothetical protein AMTR_s00124p00104500 [Amborella trichopoda]
MLSERQECRVDYGKMVKWGRSLKGLNGACGGDENADLTGEWWFVAWSGCDGGSKGFMRGGIHSRMRWLMESNEF